MSRAHSRNVSEETTSSQGSSYQLILEHLLQYPGSYEIPLRTMYTLNCAPRAQPPPRHMSRAASPTSNSASNSPVSGQFNWSEAGANAQNFTSALMSQISSLPSQPCSLPPNFIVSFVSRCFHPQLVMVDFPQALTALDYLKDLETRRQREVVAAFQRLGIQRENPRAVDEIVDKYPGVALWVNNIVGKDKKAENYYTHIYIGLRRWVMINELSLQPFDKHNCVGMLNTLFPPQAPSMVLDQQQPTKHLSPHVLKNQRDGFFDYTRQVEKKGPAVLRTVMEQGKREGEENGWANVQEVLDKYLRVAKNMIDDCVEVSGADHFAPSERQSSKKTDSGISFVSKSDKRPSTSSSVTEKPLPDAPDYKSGKGLSKLERITREFKRMRMKTRPDVEEIIKYENQSSGSDSAESGGKKSKPKSLKKARSMASLGNLKSLNGSSTSLAGRKASDASVFDPEEMKRHRQMYEQRTTKKLRNAA